MAAAQDAEPSGVTGVGRRVTSAFVPRHPTLDRLEARASARRSSAPARAGLVTIAVVRRFSDVRVPGLAAEMTYYLTLSLLPLVTALGASLGLLGTVVGEDDVEVMRSTITDAVGAVLGPRLSQDVALPLLDQLLRERYDGWALAGVIVALVLGSRVFRSTVTALGEAVEVRERRGFWRLWGLALVLVLLAVVGVTAVLSLLVVGPLLGVGQRLADGLGAGSLYSGLWSVGRWPVAVLVVLAFLALLYRVGQPVRSTWRSVLPGAVAATAGLAVLVAGFRLYLALTGPTGPEVASGDAAVRAVTLFVGTALAVMLLLWLGSIVVLSGGVVNAELTSGPPPAARVDRRASARPRRPGRHGGRPGR